MIRINLVPIEDLDNKLWWMGDVSVAIVMIAISFVGVQYYINDVKSSIEAVKVQTTEVTSAVSQYNASVAKYDEIEKNMMEIQSKLDSLQSITKSKLSKYRPLILLELIQSLKPDGMWFKTVDVDKSGPGGRASAEGEGENSSTSKGIAITGYALENVIVAEFMSELQASSKNQVDASDLRTQLYFTDVTLEDIKLEAMSGLNKGQKDEAVKVTGFKIRFNYVEREHKST